MNPKLTVFFLFSFGLIGSRLSAQQVSVDSDYQTAYNNSIRVYVSTLGDQSPLLNGTRYIAYSFTFRAGTPYYLTSNFTSGSVIYDGIRYDSLALLYEDLREQLIVKRNDFLLRLVNERISEFTVSGHRFLRIVSDSSNENVFKTGFYEILYPGTTQVLKKTSKKMVELAAYQEGVNRSIHESDYYFIRTGAVYQRIHSMGDLLSAFPNHAKEIQLFMRKNSLKYKKEAENTIIQVVRYYDQIAK